MTFEMCVSQENLWKLVWEEIPVCFELVLIWYFFRKRFLKRLVSLNRSQKWMLAISLKIVTTVDMELFWQQLPTLKSSDIKRDFLPSQFLVNSVCWGREKWSYLSTNVLLICLCLFSNTCPTFNQCSLLPTSSWYLSRVSDIICVPECLVYLVAHYYSRYE